MAFKNTPLHAAQQRTPNAIPPNQRGVTLVELMVGIAIGLLVVAVAMGALMVSRGVSGTVSDASGIQQQAAYAMRVIGMQMRQAGSLYLNPTPVPGAIGTDPRTPVAFETDATITAPSLSFAQDTAVTGTASAITTTYRRYKDNVFAAATPQSMARNCLGGPADDGATPNTDEAIENIFQLTGSELMCGGNGTAAQAIVQNVAQFQVTYMEQVLLPTGSGLKPAAAATAMVNSRAIQGVEICMVLYGSEAIDMPAGSNYKDCTGADVDMSTLTGARAKRMHMVFRNTFQLRSQGLI